MDANTQQDMAYMAGVMDSDGCFAIHCYRGRNRGRFGVSVFVSIKQVQVGAIEVLHRHFGGSIKTERPSATKGKPLFRWRRNGEAAITVCRALLPFLRIKYRQAEILIELQQEITGSRFKELGPAQEAQYTTGKRRVRRYMISDESLARRLKLVAECRALNDTRHPISPQATE